MDDKKKPSFLDDIASEKPESFNEEVFMKTKKNYIPTIIFTIIALIVFAVIYVTMTKGAEIPDMAGWSQPEVYAWANTNNAIVVANEVYDMDIEQGILIQQQETVGTKIRRNGTITVTFSKGPNPTESIDFPDVKDMTLEEIKDWIDENKLTGVTIKEENNDTFEKGTVINYDFQDGNENNFVRKNRVKIYVSLGPEELKDTITVPDFSNKTKSEVVRWATSNKIEVEYEEAYNEYVDNGKVVDQDVSGNMKMKRDHKLVITMSLGEPIIVPNFIGLTLKEASEMAELRKVKIYSINEISTKPEGTVLEQDIDAGSTINGQQLITLKVATENENVTLPNFVGLEKSEANTLAGIYDVKTFFVTKTSTEEEGIVIEQSIASGVTIDKETLVTIYVSSGDVSVPEFVGMKKQEAELLADTENVTLVFDVEPTADYENDTIISQSVEAGNTVSSSTKVMLTVAENNGVKVPNFNTMTKAQVELWASQNNTEVSIIEAYSDVVAIGNLFNQNYIDDYVPGDSKLTVYLSLGKVPVEDFFGKTKIDLYSWQKDVNDNGGFITVNIYEDNNSSQPAGTIVKQTVKNDLVSTHSSLDFWISTANINNSIPDLTNMAINLAEDWCIDNGIKYEVVEKYSDDVEKGVLFGQNYMNQALPSGETLELYKSIGRIFFPNFPSKKAVVSWVNKANLNGAKITLVYEYDSTTNDKADTVLGQEFMQEYIDVGTTVHITLKAPSTIEIPDVVGKSLSEAKQLMEDNHLEVKITYVYVNEENAIKFPKNTIIGQSQEGEVSFDERSVIDLTVSNGAKYD